MAQAILSLSPHNGWSLKLRFVDKKRAHWILQILGSGLAIAGSFIKILDKNIHWNTLHGQFGEFRIRISISHLTFLTFKTQTLLKSSNYLRA